MNMGSLRPLSRTVDGDGGRKPRVPATRYRACLLPGSGIASLPVMGTFRLSLSLSLRRAANSATGWQETRHRVSVSL
jgi:hypothetical protein